MTTANKEPVNLVIKRKEKFSNNAVYYLMLAPFFVLFFLFTVLPVISSVILSFFDFDAVSFPRFAGVDNYLRMFVHDDVFPKALSNTLVLAVVTGPLGFLIAFMLAWMVNEFGPGVRTLLSFMFYAPALAGNVYFIWQILFSGDAYGYINSTLLSFGLIVEPIQWLRNPSYALPIICIVQLWMSMGVTFLSNISGLQNVNPELYEAGAIDGVKNRWHELWYITIPSMKSILLFGVVMQIQSAFSIAAVPQALCGYPSINNSTDTLVALITDVGTARYEMGYAAAISVILFIMMFATKNLLGKLVNLAGR
ncbi:MAG: sugar ABC transporter permease [Clostridia bacterium]|nr:sugar ABC transporter permease [Clostridia bacterium]